MTTEASDPAAPVRDLDSPAARIERWIARDGEIGLAAQRNELRHQLAARDREIADLRERLAHLANALGQLRAQPVMALRPASPGRRAYRRLRRTIGAVRRS